MIIIMNGIEYTTSNSNGLTTITHDRGSFTSSLSESEAMKDLILRPLRQQRKDIFEEHGWRAHSANYPYEDQQDWVDYLQLWRDFPATYVEGEDLVIPTQPK